jgi:hypothetical protein
MTRDEAMESRDEAMANECGCQIVLAARRDSAESG